MAIYHIGTDGDYTTLAQISAALFNPGDLILFKTGEIFRGTLNIPSSGTAESPIVLSTWGNESDPKAKIYGSLRAITFEDQTGNIWRSSTVVTDPYELSYDAEVHFELGDESVIVGNHKETTGALVAEYDWTWSGNYIYVYAATDPDARYSSVEVPQNANVIYLNGKDYITIDSLDIRYASLAGIKSLYAADERHGLTVSYCDISYIGIRASTATYGINSWYSDSWYHHNKIHDCGRRCIDINCITDGQFEDNVLVENNELYNSYHSGIDCATGDLSTIQNIIIRNNLIYELDSWPYINSNYNILPIYVAKESVNATVKNIWIYNNIIKGSRRGDINITGTDLVYIWNNTLYNSDEAYECQLQLISTTHTFIKNNIIYNNTPSAANNKNILIWNTNSTYYLDYNLYYAIDALTKTMQVPSGSYTMAQWVSYKTLEGQDANSPAPADPTFTSSFDYTLQAGSPAIAAGIGVGLNTDYAGDVWYNPPSIGAYEYGSSASTLSLTEGTWLANRTTLNAMFQNLYSRIG